LCPAPSCCCLESSLGAGWRQGFYRGGKTLARKVYGPVAAAFALQKQSTLEWHILPGDSGKEKLAGNGKIRGHVCGAARL